jgi:hypothetical protein
VKKKIFKYIKVMEREGMRTRLKASKENSIIEIERENAQLLMHSDNKNNIDKK